MYTMRHAKPLNIAQHAWLRAHAAHFGNRAAHNAAHPTPSPSDIMHCNTEDTMHSGGHRLACHLPRQLRCTQSAHARGNDCCTVARVQLGMLAATALFQQLRLGGTR